MRGSVKDRASKGQSSQTQKGTAAGRHLLSRRDASAPSASSNKKGRLAAAFPQTKTKLTVR
jgi:hypothetical protein